MHMLNSEAHFCGRKLNQFSTNKYFLILYHPLGQNGDVQLLATCLGVSHSQKVVSFLMHLGVLLCLLSSAGTPDLGNEGHGPGAHVLPQELALSC